MAYLKPGGLVLLSIPNIRHYTILWRLIVRDEWSYSDAGILDNSHIRFFTLSEIKKLLNGAGLKIVAVNGRKSAGGKISLLNKLLFNTLGPFMVGQYLVMAKK